MDASGNIFSKSVIIDLGSGATKAGLSHDSHPRAVFETLVGKPINNKALAVTKVPFIVGGRHSASHLFEYEQPVKRGTVRNFNTFKLIVSKVLEDLRLKNLSETPTIITEANTVPLGQRKRIMDIVFEYYEAPSLYFGNQALLGLYGLGKTTGCVLDVGHGLSQVGCIYDGYKLDDTFESSHMGGCDIDVFLDMLMRKSGLYIKPTMQQALLKNIKETKCKLVDFSKQEMLQITEIGGSIDEEAVVVMPDGEEVKIGNEGLLAPEILFKPDLVGLPSKGVHQMIACSIAKANIELRRKLYRNIYLIGGVTSLNNFSLRLSQELRQLTPSNGALSISGSAGRRDFHSWHGASLLANMPEMSNSWIQKAEYREYGESVFERKGI